MLRAPGAAELFQPVLRTIAGRLCAVPDLWEWANGINPVRAHGRDWHPLLERAQTQAHLRMIARARGYRRGWAQHVLRGRASASA